MANMIFFKKRKSQDDDSILAATLISSRKVSNIIDTLKQSKNKIATAMPYQLRRFMV